MRSNESSSQNLPFLSSTYNQKAYSCILLFSLILPEIKELQVKPRTLISIGIINSKPKWPTGLVCRGLGSFPEPSTFGANTEKILRKPGSTLLPIPSWLPSAPGIRGSIFFPLAGSLRQGIRNPWLCGLNVYGPVSVSPNLSVLKFTQWYNEIFEEIIKKF